MQMKITVGALRKLLTEEIMTEAIPMNTPGETPGPIGHEDAKHGTGQTRDEKYTVCRPNDASTRFPGSTGVLMQMHGSLRGFVMFVDNDTDTLYCVDDVENTALTWDGNDWLQCDEYEVNREARERIIFKR